MVIHNLNLKNAFKRFFFEGFEQPIICVWFFLGGVGRAPAVSERGASEGPVAGRGQQTLRARRGGFDAVRTRVVGCVGWCAGARGDVRRLVRRAHVRSECRGTGAG